MEGAQPRARHPGWELQDAHCPRSALCSSEQDAPLRPENSQKSCGEEGCEFLLHPVISLKSVMENACFWVKGQVEGKLRTAAAQIQVSLFFSLDQNMNFSAMYN